RVFSRPTAVVARQGTNPRAVPERRRVGERNLRRRRGVPRLVRQARLGPAAGGSSRADRDAAGAPQAESTPPIRSVPAPRRGDPLFIRGLQTAFARGRRPGEAAINERLSSTLPEWTPKSSSPAPARPAWCS